MTASVEDKEYDKYVGSVFQKQLELLSAYIDSWNDDEENDVLLRLNPQALFLAVKSAEDDIRRYKSYHLADPKNGLSNAVKQSAYMCKWLCRFKPIELETIENLEDYEDIDGLLSNGSYALFLSRTLIGGELRTPFFFTENYFDEFQYDLLYREIGEDGLLHIFQMIYTAVSVERAGVLEFIDPEVVASIFDQ